jgi:hypothetical protein
VAETKGLESEIASLEKQIAGLLVEQDALRADLAAAEAANAEQSSGLTLNWWLAGVLTVVVAALAAAGALMLASRRGFTLRLPVRSAAH